MDHDFKDHADFYKRGPYASYLVEHRVCGSAPVSMFLARQPDGAYPDPAMPNLLLYFAIRGAREATFDWGAGRWRGRWNSGDLTLVPPGSASDVSLSDSHEFIGLCLPTTLLELLCLQPNQSVEQLFPSLYSMPFRDRLVRELIVQIWRAGRGAAPIDALLVDQAVLCLLARLAQIGARRQTRRTEPVLPANLTKRVTDYVEADPSCNFTVAGLAGLLGLSASHFSRSFRNATGLSPYRFVILARLRRAQTLLAEGKLSIAEIAVAVGFSSQSHFSMAFRSEYGTTPGGLLRQIGSVSQDPLGE